MNNRNLFKAILKIHKHLSDIEREYKRKNIIHRIREDWGYAFYTGKLVAYISILNRERYQFPYYKTLDKRILNLGIKLWFK